MARYRRGRKALYEVMSEARLKPGYGRTLENMRPDKPGDDEPADETQSTDENSVEKSAVETVDAAGSAVGTVAAAGSAVETVDAAGAAEDGQTPQVSVRWRRKPRVVQLNAGRIEFSLPYQLAIAVVLGLVVVALIAFRAGQLSNVARDVTPNKPPANLGSNRTNPPTPMKNTVKQETNVANKNTMQGTGNVGVVTGTGGNVIVLVEHAVQKDLLPVQAHFAGYGIETEIVNWSNRFFLVTKDRYDNPEKSGTDGYAAKQKIIEVGAKYKGKAPEGYESFAPHYFSDAYGRKVD